MTADAVIAAARGWLGTPYRHAAALRGVGCDCLGLVRGVWADLGGASLPALPPYRPDWRDWRHAGELTALAERHLRPGEGSARPGSILMFRLHGAPWPRHCAILVAQDQIIHAQERLGVIEAPLTAGWRRRLAGHWTFPFGT